MNRNFRFGDKVHLIRCECGHETGVLDRNLRQIVEGKCGILRCPTCNNKLNSKIEELHANITRLSSSHSSNGETPHDAAG
jgi:hypothetical protein